SLRSGPERRTKGWYPSRGREPTSRAACRSHERLHPRLLEGRAGARLSLMQGLVNEAELGVVDLSGARAILDVGAGLGQMTRSLARAATPGARVIGVERDPRQIAEANQQAEAAGEKDLVEIREGRAEALPLEASEWGTFDLAHARFRRPRRAGHHGLLRRVRRDRAVRPRGREPVGRDGGR